MIKKKFSLITLILSIAIIVIGYFAYVKFIRPIFLNNQMQTLTVVLEDSEQLVLIKGAEQKDIFSIEVEITGEASGIFDVLVSNEAGLVHAIALKGKSVDYIYKGDWYSDTCYLDFRGRESASGKLTVEYRFLGLN